MLEALGEAALRVASDRWGLDTSNEEGLRKAAGAVVMRVICIGVCSITLAEAFRAGPLWFGAVVGFMAFAWAECSLTETKVPKIPTISPT